MRFEVLGLTNVNCGVSIFRSLGIKAEGVHFDFVKYIREDPGMRKAMESGNSMQFIASVSNIIGSQSPKEFSQQWEVARDFQPDLIIGTTLMWFQASAIGQALRVPVIHADLGLFSFLPISKHTETPFHEPKWLHKISSFYILVLATRALNEKNKEGDSLYKVMRRELFSSLSSSSSSGIESGGTAAAGLPGSENLLGQDSAGQCAREWMNPLAPNLFAISDSVLPKSRFDDLPSNYAERSIWTGNWHVSKPIQEELARNGDPNFSNGSQEDDVRTLVSDFVDRQRASKAATHEAAWSSEPAYIGWGSMIAVSPEHMTRLAVETLKLAGLSGIILGGFGRLNIDLLAKDDNDKDLYDYAAKNVLFLQSAPHDWLFPQCCTTVHHGGAGTTAAALRSGVPTVVTPCIADQYNNALLIEEAGCGIGFRKHLRKISARELADALAKCAGSRDAGTGGDRHDDDDDSSMRSNCKRVAAALEKEDGIGNAIQVMEEFVVTKLDTGEWNNEFEARLEQRAKNPWSFWYALYRVLFYRNPFAED